MVLFPDATDCPGGLQGVPTATGGAVVSNICVFGPGCDSGADTDDAEVISTSEAGVDGKRKLESTFMGGGGGINNTGGERVLCSPLGAGAWSSGGGGGGDTSCGIGGLSLCSTIGVGAWCSGGGADPSCGGERGAGSWMGSVGDS
jgi:hypothetical protein